MWHDIIPFCAFLFLSSAQGAFLRRLECGSSDNVPIDPIFQPDSLSGYLTSSHDGITTLSLKLSGDYESHDCEAIGGSLAQLSVDGRVLDRSVIANDQLLEFKGACSEHAPTQYPRLVSAIVTDNRPDTDDPGPILERMQNTRRLTPWTMHIACIPWL